MGEGMRADKIRQNYNFDLQILQINLQLFAINLQNIDTSRWDKLVGLTSIP